jgi:energy-coupling factor transporter ATP-binding protein EcfA2
VTSDTQRLFVVTGGPGSGKTTLIDALAQAGCARSIEAGRGVIQDQVAIAGPALPWRDPQAFAELMLCWEMRSYHLTQEQAGPVFFDRGMPDVIGYLRMLGLPVPHHMNRPSLRSAIIAGSSSRRPGPTSSGKTANANRASARRCGPTKRCSMSMARTATSWSSFRAARSSSGSDSCSRQQGSRELLAKSGRGRSRPIGPPRRPACRADWRRRGGGGRRAKRR